ncbi:MAG: recombinase family protein, partial [Chloroflexota bacterium]
AYKKENEERVTIEEQLSDCAEYCRARGYEVIAEYVDKDKYRVRGKLVHPSATRKDRPSYQELLRAAKAREIDVIVAWKEDRLYRGMYAALPLSEMLDEARGAVEVELVKETFDFRMLGIKAAIAKIELDNIRDRMVMGRRARIERGEVPGGPIRYGYSKNEENKLEINEPETTIVRQIYEWYNGGENAMEIRRRLIAANVPSRVSKIWSKASIHNILDFEGYASGEYTTTLDGEVFTIACPPIISMDTWLKSREVREGNKRYRGRNVKEDYLCRSLVICMCGWKWLARTSYGKYQKGKSGYYGCARKDIQPEQVHPDCPGTIGCKKLDAFVWDFICSVCRKPDIIHKAIDNKIKALQEEQETTQDEAEQLQREIDNIAQERQWVITQARKKIITEEDMELQLAALHFQAIDLRKKYNDAKAATAVKSQAESLKAWADKYLKEIEAGLAVLEIDPQDLGEAEREKLYEGLEAARFLEKYEGDTIKALRWAIFEEKRRVVKTLIRQVLVVKGKSGEKIIVPQLVLEIPLEYVSLVYDDQSLAYIEHARSLSDGS